MTKYPHNPDTCQHERGFRNYGAAGVSVKICDFCGYRAVMNEGTLLKINPKASPSAKTPLGLPESMMRTKAKAKATGKAKAKALSATSDPLSSGLGPSLHSWQDSYSEPTPSQSWTQQVFTNNLMRQMQEQLRQELQQNMMNMAYPKGTMPKATAPPPVETASVISGHSWDQVNWGQSANLQDEAQWQDPEYEWGTPAYEDEDPDEEQPDTEAMSTQEVEQFDG